MTKPDPWRLLLDSLGSDITVPDTPPARTDAIFFTTRTNGERLNLRAGPGTGYDIIGKIPDYLRLLHLRYDVQRPRLGAGAVRPAIRLGQHRIFAEISEQPQTSGVWG